MNRFISSHDTLQALSLRAPKPWCKRLLLSLIEDGLIQAFTTDGDLTGRVPALSLLDDDRLAPIDGETFWEAVRAQWGIGRHFSDAPLEPEYKNSVRGKLYKVTGARLYSDNGDGPHPVSPGYFELADELNLEDGTLFIDSVFPNELDKTEFFHDDIIFSDGGKLAQPRFSWLEYEIRLSGLCFSRSAIELFCGGDALGNGSTTRSRARETKWDWAGATTSVVALANTPDGIGTGRGEQARVERAMADWFVRSCGDQPHASQIRDMAQRVMAELADK
jgi:hypothetical protein